MLHSGARERNHPVPRYLNPTFIADDHEIPILPKGQAGDRLEYDDGFGKTVQMTLQKYNYTRWLVIGSEIILFVVAILMELMSSIALFGQADIHPTTPHIFMNNGNAIAYLISFGWILFTIWICLSLFAYKFSMNGEEQLDSLVSNSAGLLVSIVTGMSLIIHWITLDKNNDWHNATKLSNDILSYISVQSALIIIMTTSSLSRHFSTYKTPVNYQLWVKKGVFDQQTVMYRHFIKAPVSRWMMILFAIVYQLTYTIMTAFWINSRYSNNSWSFNSFWSKFTITIGIMILVLCIIYFAWAIIARDYDSIYRIHYNYFFWCAIGPAVYIIFLLVCYRRDYRDVDTCKGINSENFNFLKEKYLDSITIIILVSYSLMGSGISKLWCLFTNLAPGKINSFIKPSHENATLVKTKYLTHDDDESMEHDDSVHPTNSK